MGFVFYQVVPAAVEGQRGLGGVQIATDLKEKTVIN